MPRVASRDKRQDMTVLPLSDIMSAAGVAGLAEDAVKQRLITLGLSPILGATVLMSGACGGQEEMASPSPVTSVVTSHDEIEVSWEDDWDAAFTRARAEGKPVLVNFYADWCVWCKHLESVTFQDSNVAVLLAGRVVPLSVDIDAVDVDLLRRHRVEAPPTIVLLDGNGEELGRIPGYMPPTGFLRAVERFISPPEGVQG